MRHLTLPESEYSPKAQGVGMSEGVGHLKPAGHVVQLEAPKSLYWPVVHLMGPPPEQ